VTTTVAAAATIIPQRKYLLILHFCPAFAAATHVSPKCDNAFWCLGTLLSGIHTEYIYPLYGADEAGCGGHHWSSYRQPTVRRGEDPNSSTGQKKRNLVSVFEVILKFHPVCVLGHQELPENAWFAVFLEG